MDLAGKKMIECKPGVCGGKPCIAGTRIRVQDVFVWHEFRGWSPDEIVSRFPQLTMSGVYAALAYYWNHREEIQAQMRAETEFVDSLRGTLNSPLRQKLAEGNVADHSVPS